MKKTFSSFLLLGLSAGFATLAAADEPILSSRSWRLSAGPSLNPGLRTDLSVSSARAAALFRKGAIPTGASREASRGAGDAMNLGSGRVEFPNGGFIDPSDSAGIAGETWNWYMPAGSLDASYKTSFRDPYAGGSVSQSLRNLCGEDETDVPGIRLELSRCLWESDGFGVDLGLSLGYSRKDDFFRAGGTVGSRTERTESGTYVTDVAFNGELLSDPWAQNPDGSWGSGSFDGPGTVLADGDVTVSHRWADRKRSSRSESLSMAVRGDFREIETMLLVRPYADLTDWFRVQGALGIAVARSEFDFDVSGQCAGRTYAKHESFDECGVYGVAGMGLLARLDRWNLGVDALYRFLADDIDIDGTDVRGSIERADWMLSASVGMDF